MLLFYCFLVAIPLPCITQVTISNENNSSIQAEMNKQLDQNEYNQTCAKKNGSSAIYVVKIHSSRQSKQPQSNTYRRETFRMQYMRHSSNLKTHNRMHKGEKLFKCDECGKQFSLRCNLNDHIRTHSNEKLLECDICEQFKCGKEFSRNNDLLKYEKKHKKSARGPYRMETIPTDDNKVTVFAGPSAKTIERTIIRTDNLSEDLGSTPGGALPSISLSFSFATILPRNRKLSFPGSCPSRRIYRRRNASWYRLRSELGRYLIAFEPLTFVLD
ncbi:hypothetical protein DINM_000850 [Dirofilaria immitis]|nr:hypothetical protein [Dirofilaria immitis]